MTGLSYDKHAEQFRQLPALQLEPKTQALATEYSVTEESTWIS